MFLVGDATVVPLSVVLTGLFVFGVLGAAYVAVKRLLDRAQGLHVVADPPAPAPAPITPAVKVICANCTHFDREAVDSVFAQPSAAAMDTARRFRSPAQLLRSKTIPVTARWQDMGVCQAAVHYEKNEDGTVKVDEDGDPILAHGTVEFRHCKDSCPKFEREA